jgi:hypothetical protein
MYTVSVIVSCCFPMDFLYPFSYGVRIILGLKKTGAGGS